MVVNINQISVADDQICLLRFHVHDHAGDLLLFVDLELTHFRVIHELGSVVLCNFLQTPHDFGEASFWIPNSPGDFRVLE
jgi:hypothetical protein